MYTLTVSPREALTLDWLSDRGYFPEPLAAHISAAVADAPHVDQPVAVPIPEPIAWTLLDLRDEDPDAHLACLGGDLLTAILELEESIV